VAKVKLAAGADIELLTQGELRDELARDRMAARAPFQALTDFRLPTIVGVRSGTSLSMGGDVNPEHTPSMGYTWSLRHLVIEGMTAGATPDVVNVLRGNRIIWQLTGVTFFARWGKGDIMIREGETLAYQSVGTFQQTGQIVIHGNVWQAPAQFAAELMT
jgi:hypothetical protein